MKMKFEREASTMLVVAIAFAFEYLISLASVLVAPLLGFLVMLAVSFKIFGKQFNWGKIILAAIAAGVFLWLMSVTWIKWLTLILLAASAVIIPFWKRLCACGKRIYDAVKNKNQVLAVLAVIAFILVI